MSHLSLASDIGGVCGLLERQAAQRLLPEAELRLRESYNPGHYFPRSQLSLRLHDRRNGRPSDQPDRSSS
jgi:hypothetical protein